MKKLVLAMFVFVSCFASKAYSDGHGIKMGIILGFTGPIESLTPAMAASAELALFVAPFFLLSICFFFLSSILRAIARGRRSTSCAAHATPSLRLESVSERIAKARSGSIELQKLPRTARRWP